MLCKGRLYNNYYMGKSIILYKEITSIYGYILKNEKEAELR